MGYGFRCFAITGYTFYCAVLGGAISMMVRLWEGGFGVEANGLDGQSVSVCVCLQGLSIGFVAWRVVLSVCLC